MNCLISPEKHGVQSVNMSTDSKLYGVEDSLKTKHSKLISEKSRVELKQFRKHEYDVPEQ